jgi:hypothetical protein
LGQVKNRADLIVFWGCNPAEAHPRHALRYSSNVPGKFTPEGRTGRKVVVVDVRETRTAKNADKFVLIRPGSDYEVFSALRMLVAGKGEFVPDEVGGVPKAELASLADFLKSARFGAIFFGLGITHSRGRYKNIDNALSLVAELNAHTKFVVMPMRGHYNVTGIGQVMAWETGFPCQWTSPEEPLTLSGRDRCLRHSCKARRRCGSRHSGRCSIHFLRPLLIPKDTSDPDRPLREPTTLLSECNGSAISGVRPKERLPVRTGWRFDEKARRRPTPATKILNNIISKRAGPHKLRG